MFGSTADAAVISSTFDSGSEGWTVVGDGPDTSVVWVAGGGISGGGIRRNDQTPEYLHFSAPAAYLGNMSTFYGGELSYDLLQTELWDSANWFYRVILQYPGLMLLNSVELPPNTTSFVHQIVTLRETGWVVIPTIADSSGPAATEAQFRAVLANLTGLLITGDLTNTPIDIATLDNVFLHAPEPSTGALFLVAVIIGLPALRGSYRASKRT